MMPAHATGGAWAGVKGVKRMNETTLVTETKTFVGHARYPSGMAHAATQANEQANTWLLKNETITITHIDTCSTSYRDKSGDYELQAYEFGITIMYEYVFQTEDGMY